ncbi:uncharacterized protein LOC143369097 [Andrena cerasifolii]|uniref:uncharacterized protein LOC143369097 n=1 Tax=Andrena cerasifolii TaxID=2819439 RepID=UPI0040384786
MAEDCTDADYLGAYSRFFAEFVARVNPYDQLPVSVNSYNVTDAEIVGEIINVTLQYLNQTQCPCSLQAHLAHQVIQEIKSMCKKQPEDCGFKSQEKTYTSLKLMQAITGKVNEICTRYLDNSRLALLPPPPSTPLPQVAAGGNKNCRRKMEDRYVVLHDLHATFGITDDSIANYYAVFDGHAGQDAAVYCATHLHQYLAESIFYPTNPERALRDAFVTTDAQFIEKSKTQKVCGGTTAVCTLLLNKKLYVSWVGDSSAMLIKRDSIVQLVNPHRLHREDEIQRIRKMGGVVMRSMGIMRVNGVLSVSRAIGDVRYKPFVSGDPEIKQFPLDGTEDFLVIATDGLTDYVGPTQILSVLYHEMHRNPNGLKRAHQILLQWAKHAGSKDNITLVVVLLTPAGEIAARPPNSHPLHSSQVNDILEKMNSKEKPLFLEIDDAHNAINSNILKQAIISQDPRDHEDDGILAASNGKHENGDADYDYADLGPETDVDAIDDVATTPVKNLSYEFYKDDDDDHPDKDSNLLADVDETTINDNHQPDAEDSLRGADENKLLDEIMAANVVVQEQVSVQTLDDIREGVREQIEENVNEEEAEMKDDDRVGSPANKPLQRALTPEADNVADSEDSEDEWNYFRVDPNKGKDAATPADELRERKNEGEVESPEDAWNNFGVDTSKEKNSAAPGNELQEPKNEAKFDTPEDAWNCFGVDTNKQEDSTTPVGEELQEIKNAEEVETHRDELACLLQTSKLLVEDTDAKTQSQDVEEKDIKCESPKEEFPELIDTEISAEDRALVPEQKKKTIEEEEEEQKDMSFQLNPNAAEFVPVSPQFMNNRMNLAEDFPISGSPLKQVSEMDDIQVPSQSEFDEEVCRRPREVEAEDKEYQNGDHSQRTDETDFMADRQKVIAFPANLDDSEISSTKAEFGDESAASFLTASEFHRTGISAIDESFSSSERDYDIAKDPMAMSFTPSDFEAAFDKGVDLNAVHSLSNTDLDDKNGSIEEEEEGLNAPFPEPHPELTTLASPETEQPTYTPAFPGEPAELVDLSAQQVDSETTFIGHADEPKAAVDLLSVQSESLQLEQEVTRSDHSPLTDNYSAECESEKEALSVDNERPLSPSSIDIDETKPIDETSEDAAVPETTLQKEAPAKEADTPSSLSPVPDTMEKEVAVNDEDDVVASVKDKESEVSSTSILSSLHADAPEFMPGHYSFHSVADETGDACEAPTAELDDVCQSSTTQADEVRQSLIMKTDEVCQLSDTETGDVCQLPTIEMGEVCHSPLLEAGDAKAPVAHNLDKDIESTEEKLIDMVSAEPAQENLLNFGELTEEEVCTKSQFEIPTPPSSPRIPDEVADSVDDIICPIQSTAEEKAEEIAELKEAPVETEVSIAKAQGVEETVQKSALNLSESMQEFTGLESQLQPKLEETSVETPVSKIIPELQEEILKTEELKEAVESEKLVEPLIDMKYNIREEEVKNVPSEVSEVPSELEAALIETEEAPCKVDKVSAELEAALLETEEAPCKIDEVPSELEAALLEMEEAPCKVDEVPSELETAVLKMDEAPRKVDEVPSELETALLKMEEAPRKVDEVPAEIEAAVSKMEEAPCKVDEVPSELEAALSKIEEAPLTVEEAPLTVEEAPLTVEKAPLTAEEAPLIAEEAPLTVEEAPVKIEEAPLKIEEAPLKFEEAPLKFEEDPLKVEEAPLKVEEALSEAEEALSEVKEPTTEIATEATESKVAEIAVVTAAAAAGAVAVAAAAQSKTKTKVATKPTKTATAKTAQKSTPTSPSKAVTSTTKTSTTTAKKSTTTTTARPKDLDAPKKAAVSSTTASKPPSAKPAAKATAISSSTTKSTTKTSTSAASKPKPVTTTAAKPAASDKKPTTNGEVKSLSKPATAKPPTSKVSTTTKTSLVKTAASSTRVSAGTTTTTTKARPASVTTASKPSPAAKTGTTASTTPAARPKTAPVAGNATKPRSLLTAKSPIIDKQVKETANKQISMARTSSASKTTSRLSASKTSTTSTVKRLSSTTKSTTAASPAKKLTATTKVSSRTSASGKTTTAVEKRKVLQNGVSENVELNAIIDDVPKKDLSPVVTPNDNQLIMSSD